MVVLASTTTKKTLSQKSFGGSEKDLVGLILVLGVTVPKDSVKVIKRMQEGVGFLTNYEVREKGLLQDCVLYGDFDGCVKRVI